MKRKLITVLLSVLAAFSLWLYVITVVSPDSEASFDVYVQVDNDRTTVVVMLQIILECRQRIVVRHIGHQLFLLLQ